MPDVNFYLNVYGGVEYPDLEKLLKRAGHIVDNYILHDVKPWQQEQYDLAVCAQAEYIGSVGGVEAFTEINNGGTGSLTIGSFSISAGSGGGSSGSNSSSGGASVPCPAAIAFLDKAGLTGRWLS